MRNLINPNISLKQEIIRKLHHLLIAIFPILYFYISKEQLLKFLIPICASILLMDYLRQKNAKIKATFNKIFAYILRDHEKNELSGISYFAASALIIFILFPKLIAINAFLILAFSDAFASIIGKKIKSKKFFEKSQSGSIAFFITSISIVNIMAVIFSPHILYYPFALLGVIAATLIEARPKILEIDDNFTIPMSYALVHLAFNNIWIYN